MKVYVVCGETGEYSDREWWISKAFESKPEAEEFAAELEKAAFADFQEKKPLAFWGGARTPRISRLDPNSCPMQGNGMEYYVTEVELTRKSR